MIDRTTKLRWRRRIRRSRRQVEDIGFHAEESLDKHLIRRLSRLVQVRRFVVTWLLLIVLIMGGLVIQIRALSGTYQKVTPVPGGSYTEGIVGRYTNANPLFATGPVDTSVSRLIFAGLFKHDDKNQLVGDLAENYSVDTQGTHYTVRLKPGLTWQDGNPLTADDVVFTYQVIQNPDADSPLITSWRGIKVEAKDQLTVGFELSSALTGFPHSMTNGIVPKHMLNGISMSQLRSLSFNTIRPLGSGPFRLQSVEASGSTPADREQRIGLVPFEDYNGGKPKLGRFIIRAFANDEDMLAAFNNQEINAMSGLQRIPESIANDPSSYHDYSLPLTGAVMVFFKNSAEPFNDPKVRQAMVLAANPQEIISGLGYPVIRVDEPILKSQPGYAAPVAQPSADMAQAARLLEEAGWKLNADGIREKAGKPLSFRLYSENTSIYTYVTQSLQKEWRAVGADVQVFLQQESDLQPVISNHGYDALLYGISIGPDPDVFAFWHSSQADLRSPTRFNLSEYKSAKADEALEAGRSRSDPVVRTVKYRPFLDAWHDDFPALALYQPRFLYVTSLKVDGLSEHAINTSADRFNAVQEWMILEGRVNK